MYDPLSDSEIADENAFLILENIKHSNFRSGNHGSGLDKYETKAVIKVINLKTATQNHRDYSYSN